MKKSLLLAVATAGVALFTAGAAMAHGDHRAAKKAAPAGIITPANTVSIASPAPPRRNWNNHHRDRCVTKCTGIGPFKQCKTRCN